MNTLCKAAGLSVSVLVLCLFSCPFISDFFCVVTPHLILHFLHELGELLDFISTLIVF